MKIGSEREGVGHVETFQLVNEVSMPVAKVQIRVTDSGRLMGLRVAHVHLASK